MTRKAGNGNPPGASFLLSQNAETLRTLLDSIDEGFCIIEVIFDRQENPVDFRFLDVNKPFELRTGLSDPAGRRAREIAPDMKQHWFETFGRVAKTRQPERFEEASSPENCREVHAFPMGDAAPAIVGVLLKDISAQRAGDARLKLMAGELNHRMKNVLALVQAIAQHTFRNASDAGAKDAFESRLVSLAAVQTLLAKSDWQSASLRALVAMVVSGACAAPDRVDIDGADIRVPPQKAVSLAMALHELCANAVQHGALSNKTGRILIRWRIYDAPAPALVLEWREKDGPPVSPPQREGFGTMMVRHALADQLDAEVSLDFAETGLVCRIAAPTAGMTAPDADAQ